jgi:putative FmdB family regulatory protein
MRRFVSSIRAFVTPKIGDRPRISPARNTARLAKQRKCSGTILFFQLFLSFQGIRTAIMPIYEYRCSACGFEKDALQKMSDPPLVDCPSCGKPALVKLVSAAGFQLKGSGWYATDFKSSGKKPAEKTTGENGNGAAGAGKADTTGTADGKAGDTKKPAETGASEKPATSSSESSKPSSATGPGD